MAVGGVQNASGIFLKVRMFAIVNPVLVAAVRLIEAARVHYLHCQPGYVDDAKGWHTSN
jgi:hypothetical protein